MGVENEQKWLNIQSVSYNITRNRGKDIAPLLGMKTLRESDPIHSPSILESNFMGQFIKSNKGELDCYN